MAIKRVYYDSEIHIHSQAQAEAMIDKLQADDRFWMSIRGNLVNGGTGSDLGSDIHNLIETIEEEMKGPEGLNDKELNATPTGAA